MDRTIYNLKRIVGNIGHKLLSSNGYQSSNLEKVRIYGASYKKKKIRGGLVFAPMYKPCGAYTCGAQTLRGQSPPPALPTPLFSNKFFEGKHRITLSEEKLFCLRISFR